MLGIKKKGYLFLSAATFYIDFQIIIYNNNNNNDNNL